jgi:hypothetical protein
VVGVRSATLRSGAVIDRTPQAPAAAVIRAGG